MAIGKLLELGGIDNSPSKAKQDTGKFRVARNVYPTPDNRLIPRYHNSEFQSTGAIKCYHNIYSYDSSVLSLVSQDYSGTYKYSLYKDGVKVPRSSDISKSPFLTRTEDYPQQVQCNRLANMVYYLSPYDSTLFKYDGVEVSYAGVHQPIFSCAQADLTGTKYVRVIQHRVDFEGIVTYSADILFPVLAATTSIALRTDGGAINILGPTVNVGAEEATGFGIITPKISKDIYYKCTYINYVTTLPASGNKEWIYIVISTNKAYRWTGTAPWIELQTFPIVSAASNALFPAIGSYNTLYRNTTTGLYYRWATAERDGLAYDTLSSFPVTGNPALYYCAKDTNLIYQWTGSAYVLFPDAGEYLAVINGTSRFAVEYSFSNNDYTITSFDSNINIENIGAYVITDCTGASNSAISGTENSEVIAYKVKSAVELSSNPSFFSPSDMRIIKLDGTSVKSLTNLAVGFSTDDLSRYEIGFLADPIVRNSYLEVGSRTFFSTWASATKQGTYYQKSFDFSFPESIIFEETSGIDVTTATITTSAIDSVLVPGAALGSVYDVTNVPLSLNEDLPSFYGNNLGIYCMTSYFGSLYFASDSYIHYSTASLPKRTEMVSSTGLFIVGTEDQGRNTTICGTNEFLFVSRERKNYYLTGNTYTGNYRIQNITEAEVGAWGNTSSISIKDSVIFMTSVGVYQTVEGGRTTLVSAKCPKNFESFDSMNINEDVSFRLTGFNSNPRNGDYTDNSICVAYDEYRDLLVFMKKGEENPCLVLSMKNSQFYEWDGMMKSYTNQYANCMAFIASKYYLGGICSSGNVAICAVEDKETELQYVVSNPIKLYTTWLTAGEPSLEKILLQLKIFGRVESNGTSDSITICHYKDWNLNTKITNSEYFPKDTSSDINGQVQYSHKKRLNSDKILSASVGLEVNAIPVTFEIESIEVELNSIQEGMKK